VTTNTQLNLTLQLTLLNHTTKHHFYQLPYQLSKYVGHDGQG